MLRILYSIIIWVCFFGISVAQEAPKKIEIVYGGTLTLDQNKYPGATIFNSDQDRQVQFRHEGLDVWCDIAVLYQETNIVKAYGKVFLQQGDTLKMDSNYIEYNGDTKMALAKENVILRNEKMTLETQELFFDRNLQEAYYNNYGKITDQENVLTSREGRYFVAPKKNKFITNVKIVNPEFEVISSMLDYYHPTGHLYLFGPTTITGKDYKIYCEKGYYDTRVEQGYFMKNSRIDYDNKIINGDSLYFDKPKKFSSATNNIKITDTINKVIVKGHYAEVHRAKDSMFITKKALVISEVEKDSMYIHGKRILVTGRVGERVIRAYPNARMYKSDMQGKCDSIHASQITGLTQLLKRPVLWNGQNQITGDNIHILSDTKTEKLDSLKVFDNAFIIEKDTLGTGYNQVKGKVLYGKFSKNKLKKIDLLQNTEVIYYAYDDKQSFVGINKTKCSQIRVWLDADQKIEQITFYTEPEGGIYPDDKLPQNERKFPNFLWRGDERILSKEGIFPQEEKDIEIKPIKGMKTPEEIQEEELRLSEQTTENKDII